MTDREALLALLERFGLIPVPADAGEGGGEIHPPRGNEVVLNAKYGGVEGYSGFHAYFRFDDNGKFTDLHIWE